jgi:hypothetical protein
MDGPSSSLKDAPNWNRANRGINTMGDEWIDIEDDVGNVIGQLNLTTMRALAPHPKLDKVVASGGSIFMRKNGRRTILSVDKPKKGRRGSR